jgi:hypothetical protein
VISKRACLILVAVFVLLAAVPPAMAVHAHTQRRVKRVRRARVRHLVWNPMFRGSHELIVRENEQLDSLQLPRITDDEELLALEDAEELVRVDDHSYLTVASNLDETRRYCRPWTRNFLDDLGKAYYEEFRRPLMVTSLVRTVEQQQKLRRYNKNAGPEEGETASTHLTGTTVDILKRGMTRKQHRWLEQYFLPLQQRGLIDPTEERRQPVFHVVVYHGYSDKGDTILPETPKEPAGQTAIGTGELQ